MTITAAEKQNRPTSSNVTIAEKQERLICPDGSTLTVLLSYPVLADAETLPVPTKKPRRKREKKTRANADVWSLSEFRQLQTDASPRTENNPSRTKEVPDGGATARGLRTAFSQIARIADDFFRQKTAAQDPKKNTPKEPPPRDAKSTERRLCSLKILLTEQRDDAVSFLCRIELRGRALDAFHVFGLTFSLPEGAIVFSPAFADKTMRRRAKEEFAKLGEVCSTRELRENFYLEKGVVVFFKNRFSSKGHRNSRRESDYFLTVTAESEGIKKKSPSLS